LLVRFGQSPVYNLAILHAAGSSIIARPEKSGDTQASNHIAIHGPPNLSIALSLKIARITSGVPSWCNAKQPSFQGTAGGMDSPHLAQVFRIDRVREVLRSGRKSTETVYGITSVQEARGTPAQLLAWNRGHWTVENQNHRARDVNFGEDACLSRTGHAPVNGGLCISEILPKSTDPVAQISNRAVPSCQK